MKQIKRIIFFSLLLAGFISTARAQYNYITNNGTITITGYTGGGGTVSIPSSINCLPVTSIGTNAFSKIGGISTVIFPGSVTNIGDYAFFFSYTLGQVIFSPGLTSIGNHAFDECSQMNGSGLTLPSTLTSIGD